MEEGNEKLQQKLLASVYLLPLEVTGIHSGTLAPSYHISSHLIPYIQHQIVRGLTLKLGVSIT